MTMMKKKFKVWDPYGQAYHPGHLADLSSFERTVPRILRVIANNDLILIRIFVPVQWLHKRPRLRQEELKSSRKFYLKIV